jgi:hypothetical protein
VAETGFADFFECTGALSHTPMAAVLGHTQSSLGRDGYASLNHVASGNVMCLSFSPGGSVVAAGAEDG